MLGDIPTIPTDLQNDVRALAQAAYLFRGVFVQTAKGTPIEQILQERGAVLDMADRTLDLWGNRLGMEVGALLEVWDEGNLNANHNSKLTRQSIRSRSRRVRTTK